MIQIQNSVQMYVLSGMPAVPTTDFICVAQIKFLLSDRNV